MAPRKTSKKPAKKKAPREESAPIRDRADGGSAMERYGAIAGVVLGVVGLVGFGVYVLGSRDTDEPQGAGETAAQDVPLATVVPERLRVVVHARHPHARDAFTQGLVWDHGRLFESTGLEGRSSLREVALDTGAVLRRTDNDPELFAEGLALVGDRLYQLTWQNHRAFVYDVDGFRQLDELRYDTEGWGLCYDGTHLVMSDGSSTLFFRDPRTFDIVRRVPVTRIGRPLGNLNELECVDGKVYANVWQEDFLVRIDPRTGAVDAVIDASGLLTSDEARGTDVLNGIAYVPETHRFLVTGKLWPAMFEVTFEAPDVRGR